MTTNETGTLLPTDSPTDPDTEQVPEVHTVTFPEPPLNLLDSPDDEPTPATAKIAYLLYVDHSSYQHVVGVALDEDEAAEFVRLANKGRYGELIVSMPVELLALPALWKQ